MLIRNMLLKYYAPESGGEGSGGGGIEITPEIQKLIDERVTNEVTGLKTKNSELLGTIKQQKKTCHVLTVSTQTLYAAFSSVFLTMKRRSLSPPEKLTRCWISVPSACVLMWISRSKRQTSARKKLKRSPTNSGIGSSGMQSVQQPQSGRAA